MRTTKKIAEHSYERHETHESKCAERAHLQRECGRESLPLKQRQGVTHQTDRGISRRVRRIFDVTRTSQVRPAAAPLAPARGGR
jgi:hypothetical protein